MPAERGPSTGSPLGCSSTRAPHASEAHSDRTIDAGRRATPLLTSNITTHVNRSRGNYGLGNRRGGGLVARAQDHLETVDGHRRRHLGCSREVAEPAGRKGKEE